MTTPLAKLPVPGDPAELTPEWFTSALRTNLPDQPPVRSVEWEWVGPGQGFTGQVVRVTLTTEGETRAPRQLIAKMAAPPGTARELLTDFGGYVRELHFYRAMSEKCGVPTPRFYFADHDPDSGNFVLLLEDMAPAKVGDQVEGATAEEAEYVMKELARFHATWWNDPWLLEQPWLQPPAAMAERLPTLYMSGMERLREIMAGRYPRLLAMIEKMAALVPVLAQRYDKAFPPRPYTLVHGDMRLDNLFLPTVNDGRFCVIDWQAVAIGSAGNELAYWLVLSLPVEVRRKHEASLLALYHSILVENGVTGYSLRRLKRDYSNGVLVQLAGLPVLASNLDFSSGRGQALATSALERLDAAVADLKTARTISILSLLVKAQQTLEAVKRKLPFAKS